MTAPVANDRSDPSPGAPSPDHPVRGPPGLATEVRRPSTCGTPRMTNLFVRSSNPSRFSRISPNSRISAGFSKFSRRAGLNSATKRGLSFGSVAMKAGSMEVILRRVAGAAGTPVAGERLVEEEVSSLRDELGLTIWGRWSGLAAREPDNAQENPRNPHHGGGRAQRSHEPPTERALRAGEHHGPIIADARRVSSSDSAAEDREGRATRRPAC